MCVQFRACFFQLDRSAVHLLPPITRDTRQLEPIDQLSICPTLYLLRQSPDGHDYFVGVAIQKHSVGRAVDLCLPMGEEDVRLGHLLLEVH